MRHSGVYLRNLRIFMLPAMRATTAYKQQIEEKAFERRINYDKFSEIRHEVRSGILAKMRYHQKVAAEVYGKIVYLTEPEVRALQVLAKRKAEDSDEDFKEFTDNVIIYSHCHKRRSKYKMIFRKDGNFENEFEPGFFDVNKRLYELL